MAGHSKFKKIKHKKAITDEKRSIINDKIITNIIASVHIGDSTDPKDNPRLRIALLAAKAANIPKSKTEDAILRASGKDERKLKEVMYEGFGVSGIGVIVEALTDKPNSTLHTVKYGFKHHGGSLGNAGSVTHMFKNIGFITYPASIKTEDEMIDLALNAGAEDCQLVEDEYEIICKFENLHFTKEFLEKSIGDPLTAETIWKPNTRIELDHCKTAKVLCMLEFFENQSDVQKVWSNLQIPDEFDMDSIQYC